MGFFKKLILSGLVSFFSISCSNNISSLSSSLPLKNGFPTKEGIEAYVKDSSDRVIDDFENFFKVEINDFYMYTENMEDYYRENFDSNELGNYDELNRCAVITNEEKYLDYSLRNTKKWKLKGIDISNKFVRGVMIHEISHKYISQVINEMKMCNLHLDRAYTSIIHKTNGTKFITEGINEYCSYKMGEVFIRKNYVPKTMEDILKKENCYQVYYHYSSQIIAKFLDEKGLHNGIELLMSNSPPTSEEILNPQKFFVRIK